MGSPAFKLESFSPEQLRFFAQYIENETGIQYAEANYYQLEHRLRDISLQLGFGTLEKLWTEARKGIAGSFRNLLLDLATNNETSFFRDPGIFRAFEQVMVPSVANASLSGTPIRIWSAASSTGQEPYSLAMILAEMTTQAKLKSPYSMLVTDFSERVLARTREGLYSQLEVQRGLPARLLVQHFSAAADSHWQANESLRRVMSFKKLNLIEPFGPIGEFDIIFCRNVLIYQSVENKKDVISRMARVLKPGGFLVLGAAESLLGLSQEFEQCQFETSMFFKLKASG